MSDITFTGPDAFSAPVFNVGLYSDGTPMIKSEQFDEIVDNADTMILRPINLSVFTTALFMVDAIFMAGGEIKSLVLPYIPGARQDRSNPTGDVLFTAASVAGMINQRNFERVVVVDPHSPVSSGLINNCLEYPLERIASRLYPGYGGIIAPDKGAKGRAEKIANAMGKDIVYGSKVRDVSTGRLSGFDISVEAGKHYLVVDDICDGGGTFIGLGEKIREQGAFADLYVTHGIFSKGTTALKSIYKNIITTDSRVISDRNDVMTMTIVKDMENYYG